MKPDPNIDDYVIEELNRLKKISGLNLPRLMNQYNNLIGYRLNWKINEDVTKEQMVEMSRDVLKYMKVSYMKKAVR